MGGSGIAWPGRGKGWICSANFLGCFLGAPQESAQMRGPGAMRALQENFFQQWQFWG